MSIGIGETLRAARREQGLSLSDAAEATRIRQRYLSALEDDEFEVLGEDVYVRGFLRNYARYLGLDPLPLLSEYRATFQPPQDDTPVATAPAIRQRVPLPRAVRTVAAAGTLVLLLGVVAVAGDRSGSVPDEPAPPVVTTPAATGEIEPTPEATPPEALSTATPAPTASPVPPLTEGVELVLEVAGGPSWVRVVVDGVTELEATLPDGVSHTFRADESIVLRVGDAGNVHLTVDGDDHGPAGDPGAVLDLEFTTDG